MAVTEYLLLDPVVLQSAMRVSGNGIAAAVQNPQYELPRGNFIAIKASDLHPVTLVNAGSTTDIPQVIEVPVTVVEPPAPEPTPAPPQN